MMAYIIFLISKSTKTAMLLTTLIPGGGQFYTERYFKGLIIGGAQTYFLYREINTQIELNKIEKEINKTIELEQKRQKLLEERTQLTWWIALVWTIGILDAYIDAQLYNFESSFSLNCSGTLKAQICLKF
ncbi:MAG: DUF5683 domain-containing protein [candidate division WOR-3 bacterium]